MSPKKIVGRCCLECSTPLPEAADKRMRFCPGGRCKTAFNNRQKTRGDLIYPLVMAMRYDREAFAEAGVWKKMCRLMAGWHDEDLRAGRKSFEPLDKVLPRLYDQGHLQRGEIVAYNAAGNRR